MVNPAAPRSSNFSPHVRSAERLGSKQDNQFVRTLQEVQDVFLEIRFSIDFGFGFVQERSCAAGFDLTGHLLGHPCVGATDVTILRWRLQPSKGAKRRKVLAKRR